MARRIVELAGVGPDDRVVEVGAGLGSLTVALAASGAPVTAVEIDARLIPALTEVTAGLPRVSVVRADAMTARWGSMLEGDGPWVLVANLPYNVATPVVLRFLQEEPRVRPDAGDGPARGGRAAGGRPRRRSVRRGEPARRVSRGGVSWRGASRRRCSGRCRTSSRCWFASSGGGSRPWTRTPGHCSSSSTRRSRSGGRPCAARSSGWASSRAARRRCWRRVGSTRGCGRRSCRWRRSPA